MTGLLVAVRADASREIGTGHVMRCLSLAEGLAQEGAQVFFISRGHPGNVNREIEKRGFEVRDLPPGTRRSETQPGDDADSYLGWLGVPRERDARECIEALGDDRPEWLVVDHYALDASWEVMLRPSVGNIFVIDDLANRPHDCDVLLDQGVAEGGSRRWHDRVPAHCTRLLGPRFALLRADFGRARRRLRQRDGTIGRVLVTFGGVDAANLTGRTLDALRDRALADLAVDVVVGAGNPNFEALQLQAKALAGVSLYRGVDDMAELMARADVAFGAGGATTWEMLCMGLPAIIVTAARNQRPSTQFLHDNGYVTWLGDAEHVGTDSIRTALLRAMNDAQGNRDMERLGRDLVDGNGVGRIAGILCHGMRCADLKVRRASPDDRELFWDWVNDPDVRANAFNRESIPWAAHERWYDRKLDDAETVLLVVESAYGPLGQVRFEKSGGGFVVSYSLGRQFRGKGTGRPMLARAIGYFRELRDDALIAETLSGNHASARIFERLGFVEVDAERTGSRRFRLDAGRLPREVRQGSPEDDDRVSTPGSGSTNAHSLS